ncbi:MAG: hypothetical protein IJ387_11840, partial [Thermoguttaceae bacterium]|nr:hypothetical protein [Thermoguttaceae bacterium]
HVSYVDSKGWKLSTPLWKKTTFATGSAAVLDDKPTAAELGDAFFADEFNDWTEFADDAAAEIAPFVGAPPFESASVFETLNEIFDAADERRKRRSLR